MELLQQLHGPTLMITFAVIGVALGLSILVYWWRQRSIPGLGMSVSGVLLSAIGVAILAARVAIPLPISVMFGQAGIAFGTLGLLFGLRLFAGRPTRWPVPVASACLTLAVLTHDVLTRDDLVLRSIVVSFWLGSVQALIAWESWHAGRHVASRLWVLMSLIFGLLSMTMLARIVDILLHPDRPNIFAPSAASGLSFLVANLTLVVACIAMLALANDWLQRRLEVEAADNARVAAERDRAAQNADTASQAKSVFLAAVSHEIRTPINAVLGGLEILNAPGVRRSPEEAQVLNVMEKAGQSMLALLDDLLDITRIESGHLSLQPQPIDLHQRLHDAIDLMAGRAAAAGLALELSIGSDVPRHVILDPARLRQVLLNLIGNAVKFTRQGGIKVSVSRRPSLAGDASLTPGAVLLRIIVADTGIGISPSKLPRIFEAFYQADVGDGRRFGGVGLGLSISKRLIGMMGGTIDVDSAVGYGSAFTLDLPVPLAAAPAPVPGSAARMLPYWAGRPPVLLVEDDAINQFVATQLLTRQGVQVIAAPDGEAALALLSRQSVKLVLMDIGMPGLDGFETTARLRESRGAMANVPVIALTANVLPETVTRSRAVGMQGFIAKPIKLEELLNTLATIIPPDGFGPVAAHTGDGPALSPERGPLAPLCTRLGTGAVDNLLSIAAGTVADTRAALFPVSSAPPPVAEIRNMALRMADALDGIGYDADAQALRDCLTLLRPGQQTGTALAAMDAILADTQARLPRSRASAAE